MYESKEVNEFKNKDDFKINCFQGLIICLFGYTEKKHLKALKEMIEKYQGILSLFEQNIDENCDFIVVNPKLNLDNKKLNELEKFSNKMVIEEWLFDCYQNNKFISDLKLYKYKNNLFKSSLEVCEKEILKNYNSWEEINGIFSEYIFYISPNLDKTLKNNIKKAIGLGKGIVFNTQTKLTTHVICNSNTDVLQKDIFKNQKLVVPKWVVDCLHQATILPYEDYKPANSENISMSQGIQTIKYEAINRKIYSSIFKKTSFSILMESYQENEIKEISDKILQHSGTITKFNLEDNSHKQSEFLILNDGYIRTTEVIQNKKNQILISHRYLDFCIEKKEKINIKVDSYFHLLPFGNQLPFSDFLTKVIYFYGFSFKDTDILERLAITLGASIGISK